MSAEQMAELFPEEGASPEEETNGKGLEVYRIIEIHHAFRKKYRYDEPFSSDFRVAREIAHRIRGGVPGGSAPVRASELNALALLEEILRYVLHLYLRQRNPSLFEDLLGAARLQRPGPRGLEAELKAYVREFPPLEVQRRLADPAHYLEGKTRGVPNRSIALQGLVLLTVAGRNPAYAAYRELFDEQGLLKRKNYAGLYAALHEFFQTQPRFGPDDQSLLEMLRSPAVASPDSLYGQLEYIRHRWGSLLGRYLWRLLRALDFLREEQKLRLPLAGVSQVHEFAGLESEDERFSLDREWMPHLVLMAKSALVWLDQLSRKYGREIRRLNQIPDEELDALSRWGFTGLWLIGIWERSSASRRIKRLCGNPEAESSAYSLTRYAVADSLGGDQALEELRSRCLRRGIRLASDMVPNHTGLDSPWMRERPDWYIQLSYPPFPAYTFNGPNLSEDPGFGLFLEDHYYDRADAAVVFKRLDFGGGQARYIYHGNDGTHLPWNDTAQLDYLNPEVREAVIRTILEVARHFPIIRFDAAMTLTRRHYQRLWFPEPGSGGDIPSRSEHGLSRAQFQRRMPQEFWREVVDRIAREAPDTLLLAEAFWLMEGYFVRTLGMHRVYNSAFMNMLKAEENRNYRALIKNTLEFDPQILKRYVNFMNNPDEETAVVQFGKGDKYFGICLLMATLPGLPMFGHGQVEGLREKYGMEYNRAYVDESPDFGLIGRHEHEIFPLLRRRHLFTGVESFFLYDLFTAEGMVNEDVFAFSNRWGQERALVFYNNRYAEARGWIRLSAAFAEKTPDGGKMLRQVSLGEGLGLSAEDAGYCLFREVMGGLEFIRPSRALHENGLYVELSAYQYQVFTDFRQVSDSGLAPYAELCATLNGRGVPSLEDVLADIVLRPVQESFRTAYQASFIRSLITLAGGEGVSADEALEQAQRNSLSFYRSLQRFSPRTGEAVRPGEPERTGEPEAQAASVRRRLETALAGKVHGDLSSPIGLPPALAAAGPDEVTQWCLSWAWILLAEADTPALGARLVEELRLEWVIRPAWESLGLMPEGASQGMILLKALLAMRPWLEPSGSAAQEDALRIASLREALLDGRVKDYLQVHPHEDALWFNREALASLLWWVLRLSRIINAAEDRENFWERHAARLLRAAEESGFRYDALLELLNG